MGFFSKLAKNTKSVFKKGAHAASAIAKKGGDVLHSVNKVADSIAGSSVGKALLDAVPEGKALYQAGRKLTGSLEKGAYKAQDLAKGAEKIADSKTLSEAVSRSKKLHQAGSQAIGDGRHAYRQHKAGLEKASSDFSNRMRNEGSRMEKRKRTSGIGKRMRKKVRSALNYDI